MINQNLSVTFSYYVHAVWYENFTYYAYCKSIYELADLANHDTCIRCLANHSLWNILQKKYMHIVHDSV